MKTQTELMASAIGTLLRVFTVNERKFPAAEGRARYNPLEFESLAYIEAHPHTRLKDIANYLGVSVTTVQSVVDRLVRRGFLVKDAHRNRGRAMSITLSEDGHSLQRAIQRQNIANSQRMLEQVPHAERENFVRNLSLIAKAFD